MDLTTREANAGDINTIEKMAKKGFDKFGISSYGLDYDSISVKAKLIIFMTKEEYRVGVVERNNEIVGFIIMCISETLYSVKQKQLQEVAMQSDPSLDNFMQGKIILKLIEYSEGLSKQLEADITGFSIMSQYDISGHILKKGYKLSDKIYIKKRGVD